MTQLKPSVAAETLRKPEVESKQMYAYLSGAFVKLEDAKVSVMTHAFNYGTGVFEGIRGYYAKERDQLYLFRLREHFERMQQNCKILRIRLPLSIDELCKLTIELAKMNDFREDIYVRPIAFKAAKRIGVKMDDQDDFTMFMVPFGEYTPTDRPLSVCVSSWRRVDDNAIPPRAKICGAYVNSALAGAEAHDNGFDEAIFLNYDGHVSEGSAMNLFLVKRGRLVTTPVSDNILEGITRNTVIEFAKEELGIETDVRQIDRTELYTADEVFFCGTGAQIAAVGAIDRRPIGDGGIGPVTKRIKKLYYEITHGQLEKYMCWLTPVY